MTRKKVPTTNELMRLSGLDKSPHQVLGLTKSSIIVSVWSRFMKRLKSMYWNYVYFRLKDISTDNKLEHMIWLGVCWFTIILEALCVDLFGIHSFVTAVMVIPTFFALGIMIAIIAERSDYNWGAAKVHYEAGNLIATQGKSLWRYLLFIMRNIILSAFDLFIFKSLKKISHRYYPDQNSWANHSDIYFDRRNIMKETLVERTGSNQYELIRKHYTDGLKHVENELIGPNSDWSKTLVDLKDRKEKLERNISRLDNRIAEAKRADDDARYLALTSAKVRSISSQRGLNEAIEAIEGLVKRTRDEINKLYKLVDSMGDVYQDAELIKESDALIADNERAIDYAQQLRDQAYEKVTRQLTAVAGVVIGHQLLPDPSVEAIDMPLYLERIEKAAESISKIEEAA